MEEMEGRCNAYVAVDAVIDHRLVTILRMYHPTTYVAPLGSLV